MTVCFARSEANNIDVVCNPGEGQRLLGHLMQTADDIGVGSVVLYSLIVAHPEPLPNLVLPSCSAGSSPCRSRPVMVTPPCLRQAAATAPQTCRCGRQSSRSLPLRATVQRSQAICKLKQRVGESFGPKTADGPTTARNARSSLRSKTTNFSRKRRKNREIGRLTRNDLNSLRLASSPLERSKHHTRA